MTMLRVQDLSKHFTLHLRGGLQLPVLQDVSMTVEAGECVALAGPSGRGKSTLVKCLHGNYGADAGSIWFESMDGAVDIARATPQRMLELRRSDIACVSQFLRVVPRVSALDVVAERWMAAQPRPERAGAADGRVVADGDLIGPDDDQAVRARSLASDLLERLNLPPALWDLPPATFSGGEQQRVNIARGFVQPARLLLLDEPTASLDARNRDVVIELIREARSRGSAIVGIFHDRDVRDAVATRCIEMGQAP